MSVGLVRAEMAGEHTLVAQRFDHSAPQLPSPETPVRIEYVGKLPVEQVLKSAACEYVEFRGTGGREVKQIEANAFILADNWFGLHSLLESGMKAKLVYLDPPYATGFGFQSRQLEHAYNDILSGAAYLEYIRRRLILIREILADDGSVYVHIGHQMLGHVKAIMDEVYGPSNLRNIITRRKCSSKNFTKNQFANIHDYVLFYTKTSAYIWNQPSVAADPEWIAKEYPKVDDKGQYKLVPVHAPGVRRGETGLPWRGKMPPPGKHWQYPPAKLDELDRAGEIHWSKTGNPRRKVYLPEQKRLAMTDYWEQYRDAHHQSILVTGYPTEKNFEMLKMIVAASSNPGDIVVDPFCGSGTTLDAANDLKRRWIGIDESFAAAKATLRRLRHGRKVMGDYVNAPASPVEVDLFVGTPHGPEARAVLPADFGVLVDKAIYDLYPRDIMELIEGRN